MTIVDRRMPFEEPLRPGPGEGATGLDAGRRARRVDPGASRSLDLFLRAATTPAWAVVAAYAVIVLAYLFQAATPSFNEDDVLQIQNFAAPDQLPQGRWGYAFLYYGVLGGNPAPIASTLIGVAAMTLVAFRQAAFIGLRRNGARLAFVLISCVSIYFGFLYSYDSVRAIYPFANLFVMLGLERSARSRSLAGWMLGAALIGLAPAIYTSALMQGATTVLVAVVAWSLRDGSPRRALLMAGRTLAATIVGMALYAIATDLLYAVAGWDLGARAGVDPFGVADRWPAIVALFKSHSAALIADGISYYFPFVWHALAAVAYVAVGWLIVRRSGARATSAVAFAAMAASLVSPFCLILISQTDQYLERSLYAYATATAGFFALAFDRLIGRPKLHLVRMVVAVAAAGFLAVNFVLVSQRAYDEWLAWRADETLTQRIVVRIDRLLEEEDPQAEQFTPSRESAPPAPIPLAVFGVSHWRAGPRGEIQTIRLFRHSRERVFMLIEPRFSPASDEKRTAVETKLAGRAPWPAAGSVFLHDGVVVVLLSDEGVGRW